MESLPLEQLSRNLSNADRGIRLALSVALLVACLARWVDGHLALAFFLFAWVPIVTGLAGWCPVYQLFGISSRRK
ncbi:MAG TPA: DUF2892 domain-containing protein [Thermoanaerobaculia bacterium]